MHQQYLDLVSLEYSPFITLCFGSIGMDRVIIEPRYNFTKEL